jgi:hypothetical protein
MQPAAYLADAPAGGSWHITREGTRVATVGLREERGKVVVAADIEGAKGKEPYRFPTVEAANEFLTDLMTSFAYLGCDVARG